MASDISLHLLSRISDHSRFHVSRSRLSINYLNNIPTSLNIEVWNPTQTLRWYTFVGINKFSHHLISGREVSFCRVVVNGLDIFQIRHLDKMRLFFTVIIEDF